jgi:uncharacterized protein
MPIKPLVINDKIYGKVEITSPVILELINSGAMQRLKGIGQYGVPDEFYNLKNYSRYDHSIGVFIILHKLKASEEEQIAGLLHDISHTAFSHVIDWVIGEGDISENYQDTQHKKYSLNPTVNRVLKKYHYDPDRAFDHKLFPLLENNIPKVCADRVDYSLQEFSLKIAQKCFKGLRVVSDSIVFNDKESAKLFGEEFLKRNLKHWAGYEAVVRYRLFANVLKIALKTKIIKFSDFEKDDNFITEKLKKSKNTNIQKLLEILRHKSLKDLPKGKDFAYKKFRHVDPLFLENGKLYKLSTVDKEYKNYLEKVRKVHKEGIRLPKISQMYQG